MERFRRGAAVSGLVAALAAAGTGDSRASSFTVSPTQIHLTREAPSRLLALRNEGDELVRVELSLQRWEQGPLGEIRLDETGDIVFYPPLLELAPHEERKIRIGAATDFAAVEKSYRLFVEELPPMMADHAGSPATGVRVLTRMGIPVFLRPAQPHAAARFEALEVSDGAVWLELRNTGNSFLPPEPIRLCVFDAAGAVVFERNVSIWYVLAGGHRLLTVPLGPQRCMDLAGITVDAPMAESHSSLTLERPGIDCAR